MYLNNHIAVHVYINVRICTYIWAKNKCTVNPLHYEHLKAHYSL